MDAGKERILKFLKKTGRNKLFLCIFFVCFFCGTLPLLVSFWLYPVAGAAACLFACALLSAAGALAAACFLHYVIRVLARQDEELVQQLHTVSKNAGQHVLLQLLQQDMAQGEKTEALLAQSGIEFLHPYYCAAVIRLDDFWLASEEFSEGDIALFKFSMANIVLELLKKHMEAYLVENGMDYLTLILNLADIPKAGELAQIFKEAVGYEADYFGIGFSVGIGTVGEGIGSISESYNNALDAVAYRLFFGKQSVTEYGSIKGQEGVHIDYPYEMEQEILRQAMRFHNRVKTMECLDSFLEQVGHISAEDASLYIHQLGVAVNRALRQTDRIQADHLYSMRQFSHFMDSLPTLKEKQQQIRTTLDELFTATAEDSGRKKQGIVQKVEEHFSVAGNPASAMYFFLVPNTLSFSPSHTGG